MTSFSLARYVAGVCTAIAMLAGCGGSQSPIAVPGVMPQTSRIGTHADRGMSWMLPEAKSEDLLYASSQSGPTTYYRPTVWVFSFPQGKLVGKLMGFSPTAQLYGLCTDHKGDIFVTASGTGTALQSQIYEFAHGGTQSKATLNDPGSAIGCAVDPTTGNLAVTNNFSLSGPSNNGNVEIYRHAKGRPTMYYDKNIYSYYYCAYDDKGDLFVDGVAGYRAVPLGELLKGSASFSDFTLNTETVGPGSLQ